MLFLYGQVFITIIAMTIIVLFQSILSFSVTGALAYVVVFRLSVCWGESVGLGFGFC